MPRTLHSLPTDPTPVNERCLILFVPDDDAYLRAVMGQLGQLGQWYNWQRDNAHTAIAVAQHWRDVWSETLDLWSELEYDLCPLTINVNCGSSGGSDCCNQLMQFDLDVDVHVPVTVINEILLLPGGQVDNGYQPPSEDWPDYGEYVTTKCAYANQLALDVYNSWENIATLSLSAAAMSFPAFAAMLSSGALFSSLAGLIAGAFTGAAAATALVGILLTVGTVVGIAGYAYFEDLQQQMSVEELRCVLYGATNAEEARDLIADTFHEWGIQAGLLPIANGALIDIFVNLARAMTPVTLLEPLFDMTDYATQLPTADCSMCAGVTPPPGVGLAADLVAAWEFENAANPGEDTSENAFDLDTNSGATTNDGGYVGRGGDCTGIGFYSRPNVQGTLLDMADGQSFTIAAWVWLLNTSGNHGVVGRLNGASSAVRNYYLGFYPVYGNSGWDFGIQTASSLEHVTFVGATPQVNSWHLVIGWYDDDTKTIGISVDNGAPTEALVNVSGPIGGSGQIEVGRIAYNTALLDGYIDQVFIWRKYLDAGARAQVWNGSEGIAASDMV